MQIIGLIVLDSNWLEKLLDLSKRGVVCQMSFALLE